MLWAFTIVGGLIVEIDMIADPAKLRGLPPPESVSITSERPSGDHDPCHSFHRVDVMRVVRPVSSPTE